MAKQNKRKKNKATQPVKKAASRISTPSIWSRPALRYSLIAVLAITFLCFFNTLENEFVNWDDDRNFYENEYVTSINGENFWSNTKKIFSSNVIGNYNPLTIWTFALEKQFYGFDNPGKWHLTNVLLHLLCVFFVFKICVLLGLKWPGALAVSLLFGIHPMRVESVAWVTERKDVLFGVFYLAAFYLYIKQKITGKSYLFWIMFLFILSLFSKIQAVILPLSMIVVDYYLDDNFSWKSILKKWPFFVLSLIFGLIGIVFLQDQGSFESATIFPIWQRVFIGTYSYIIYLIKAVIPFQLSPLYPYPSEFPVWFYPTIIVVPLVLWGLFEAYKRGLKTIVFGILFFTFNIMFLLQILGAGQGFVADRFTYIAYFGLFFIFGFYFEKLFHIDKYKNVGYLSIGVITLIFGYMTFQQNKVWKNSETLWTHVLKYYKDTTLPWGNRANYLRDQGRIQEALRDYSMSIQLDPEGEQAYNSRARLYFDTGKTRDTLILALQDYNKAIQLDPNNGEFYVNRGATHARLGDLNAAIADFNRGIELKPDHAVGYLNRSVIYNQQGNYPEALADINAYLNLNPYNGDIWYERARILRSQNKLQDAIQSYSEAIKVNNRKGLYYYERARTYDAVGQSNKASQDLSYAISLGYNNIDPSFRSKYGM